MKELLRTGHHMGSLRPRRLMHMHYEATQDLCVCYPAQLLPPLCSGLHVSVTLQTGWDHMDQLWDSSLLADSRPPCHPCRSTSSRRVFGSDLLTFQQVVEHAESLQVFAPLMLFLDLPQVSFFEAGRFPSLIPLMRSLGTMTYWSMTSTGTGDHPT